MSQRHYLLIIDPDSVNDDLKNYFVQFNLDIVQQNTLYPIQIDNSMPEAILIHRAILQKEPKIIQQFYERYPVPLIVISDTWEENSCIFMLESGADDFIIKPLYPRELHARINAITRRILRAEEKLTSQKNVLIFKNWRLYPASRRVYNDQNQEVRLSAGEYDLLITFAQKPQQILNREFLSQVTKDRDFDPFDRRIDVQISRLRQKIELDAKKPILIKTVRNGGYMFTPQVITLKEKDRE